MYNENKTTEHERNTNGNVSFQKEPKEKNYGGLAKFLGGAATCLALMFALSALLLHTAIQTNAGNELKIRELERTTAEQRETIEMGRSTVETKGTQFNPALNETPVHITPTPQQIQPAQTEQPQPNRQYARPFYRHTRDYVRPTQPEPAQEPEITTQNLPQIANTETAEPVQQAEQNIVQTIQHEINNIICPDCE